MMKKETEGQKLIDLASRLSYSIKELISDKKWYNKKIVNKLHTSNSMVEFLDSVSYICQRIKRDMILSDEDKNLLFTLDVDDLSLFKSYLNINLNTKESKQK